MLVREQHAGECLRVHRTIRNRYAVEQRNHASQCHRRRRVAPPEARGSAQGLEAWCFRNACGEGRRGPDTRGLGPGENYFFTMTSRTIAGPRLSAKGRTSRAEAYPVQHVLAFPTPLRHSTSRSRRTLPKPILTSRRAVLSRIPMFTFVARSADPNEGDWEEVGYRSLHGTLKLVRNRLTSAMLSYRPNKTVEVPCLRSTRR